MPQKKGRKGINIAMLNFKTQKVQLLRRKEVGSRRLIYGLVFYAATDAQDIAQAFSRYRPLNTLRALLRLEKVSGPSGEA